MRRHLIFLLAASLFFAFGCKRVKQRKIKLDLQTRPSCQAASTNYNLTCVAALEVRVLSATKEIIASRCHEISTPYLDFQDLITSGLTILEDVNPQIDVTIELRAYHAQVDVACSTAGLSDNNLMFWGESEVANITDKTDTEIRIFTECRPDCPCDQLGTTDCSLVLDRGGCAPVVENRTCLKSCSDNDDCYGGQLLCNALVCQAGDGNYCDTCAGASDCTSLTDGFCMSTPQQVGTEEICTTPCPAVGSATPCPTQMSCKKLDVAGSLYQTIP